MLYNLSEYFHESIGDKCYNCNVRNALLMVV